MSKIHLKKKKTYMSRHRVSKRSQDQFGTNVVCRTKPCKPLLTKQTIQMLPTC